MGITNSSQNRQRTPENLDSLQQQARKKVGDRVCHYIPGKDGKSYVHHFTWEKMVDQDPSEAARLLHKYILDCTNPKPLAPKQRAPRGSRGGKNNLLQLNSAAVQKLLQVVQDTGNKQAVSEALSLLVRSGDLKSCIRAMKGDLRNGVANEENWLRYKAAVNAHANQARHTG